MYFYCYLAFVILTRIDPSGEFFNQPRSLLNFNSKPRSAEAMIKAEMEAVRKESLKKIEKLRFATDVHCGLEILHSFVLDLLGRSTPAAKIFLTKSEEE